MKNTTICYLKREGRYLLLYRNKKKDDPNAGKWIGVGGHQEEGESPLDCVCREFMEETGLTLQQPRLLGLVQFIFEDYEDELMFCYKAEDCTGELIESCSEGELAWIEEERFAELPMWEGDRLFMPRVLNDSGFFCLKLMYDAQGALVESRWEKV